MSSRIRHHYFSTHFARLCREHLHAHFTGRYAASRDHWMAEARYGNPDLKALHVSFARNAHRAFLYDLRKALEK